VKLLVVTVGTATPPEVIAPVMVKAAKVGLSPEPTPKAVLAFGAVVAPVPPFAIGAVFSIASVPSPSAVLAPDAVLAPVPPLVMDKTVPDQFELFIVVR
jgi:hypothetical protein